jgi:hypothetical protein
LSMFCLLSVSQLGVFCVKSSVYLYFFYGERGDHHCSFTAQWTSHSERRIRLRFGLQLLMYAYRYLAYFRNQLTYCLFCSVLCRFTRVPFAPPLGCPAHHKRGGCGGRETAEDAGG